MTTKNTTVLPTNVVIARGAYTHLIVHRDGMGYKASTACNITVDDLITVLGPATSVDCPYCLGRRSKWESKAAR